jgi:hypothetical protein
MKSLENRITWEVCETLLFGKFGQPNYLEVCEIFIFGKFVKPYYLKSLVNQITWEV